MDSFLPFVIIWKNKILDSDNSCAVWRCVLLLSYEEFADFYIQKLFQILEQFV